ncbi:Uncharacterized protein dnl_45520 [Desulfonema limicola]|uniref:Uncharacterized protein n=1 Tax=Desulfonema limicola TaxID=45656 RepID=A0A975GI55_9BACT|nr:Uncharacterized protein dnl_45520 [Desulfonema limicola]
MPERCLSGTVILLIPPVYIKQINTYKKVYSQHIFNFPELIMSALINLLK